MWWMKGHTEWSKSSKFSSCQRSQYEEMNQNMEVYFGGTWDGLAWRKPAVCFVPQYYLYFLYYVCKRCTYFCHCSYINYAMRIRTCSIHCWSLITDSHQKVDTFRFYVQLRYDHFKVCENTQKQFCMSSLLHISVISLIHIDWKWAKC